MKTGMKMEKKRVPHSQNILIGVLGGSSRIISQVHPSK